ncbi:MAG: hypothetical protein L6Q97_01130 [Thermoanaerobaculia bacterium]|nr:hypothetical protein [Thermoanaerobaculia bacterium]
MKALNFMPANCRVLCIVYCLVLAACGGPNTPLDAGTRQAIDSIAAAETRQARVEIDSLCKMERTTVLPRLVDSIKQKRLREIQEQLKTVPK